MTVRAAGRLLASVFSALLVSVVAGAENTPVLQKFDTNKNGFIDPDEATPSFLNYFNQIVLPGLDAAGASNVADEPAVAASTIEPVVAPLEDISGATLEIAEPEPLETEVPGEAASAAGAKYTYAFLLRSDAADSSIPEKDASLDNVSGAFVSYANDVRQSTEEWQVKGALLYPVRFDKGEKEQMNGTRLTAYTFIPSVSFDRKFDSEDVASELDTLTFEVGSEWEFSGGPWFEKQYVRLGPFYATDFSFESAVTGVEMEYEVLNAAWGLGAPAACFYKRFECEWSAKLMLAAGKTLEVGDKVNLSEDEDFITLGPELSLALSPTFRPLDRLKLDASWYYIEDISGDSGAADQLEAGISFGLDENGHVRLRTEYRHGDLRYTRDKITIITTGLEVKF